MTVETEVGRRHSRQHRRLWRVVGAAAVALVVWLLVGTWFAQSIARSHFLATYSDGRGGWAGGVVVETVSPAVPPFFEVHVSGVVGHADWYSYMNRRTEMVLWVEPVSGYVIRWKDAERESGPGVPGDGEPLSRPPPARETAGDRGRQGYDSRAVGL